MKKINEWWISIYLVIICFFSLPVLAEEFNVQNNSNTKQFTTKFLGDQSLTGTVTSQTVYFQILDYWIVDSVQLNLDYQVTQIIEKNSSDLTISLNGIKFHSFSLESNSLELQKLKIEVPKEKLVIGVNTIVIQGSISSINKKDYCTIPDSSANWLTTFESSNVNVTYHDTEMNGTIKDFHERFSGIDTIKNGQAVVSTSSNLSPTELEGATYVLSSYARSNIEDSVNIPLTQYEGANDKQANYHIIVGLYDNLSPFLREKIPKNELRKNAVVKLISENGNQLLVITSLDESALLKAAQFVSNPDLMSQVSENEKIITPKTSVETVTASRMTFIEFDKDGKKLEGPFHQEAQFNVVVPENQPLSSESRISVNYRYSKNLDFNRSLVTILINGVPIGSKKLTYEQADQDSFIIDIPDSVVVNGTFLVTVTFDLEIQDLPCTLRQSEMPWAYIIESSGITLKTNEVSEVSFDSYPYPFIQNGVYQNVGVILPKEIDDSTYKSLAALFNYLGNYIIENNGTVKYFIDSTKHDNNELSKYNLIVLGNYKNNSFIKEINNLLYFQYNDTGEYILPNKKKNIESQYGAEIGIGQLLKNPDNSETAMLVITSANSKGEVLSAEQLSNKELVKQKTGEVFIVDSDGNSDNFQFNDTSRYKDKTNEKKITSATYIIIFIGSGFIIGIIVIIYLVRKNSTSNSIDN